MTIAGSLKANSTTLTKEYRSQIVRFVLWTKLQMKTYASINHIFKKKFKLSQAAFASVFNISVSTVQKWEQEYKKPAGASMKLLDIIDRKGLQALI